MSNTALVIWGSTTSWFQVSAIFMMVLLMPMVLVMPMVSMLSVVPMVVPTMAPMTHVTRVAQEVVKAHAALGRCELKDPPGRCGVAIFSAIYSKFS